MADLNVDLMLKNYAKRVNIHLDVVENAIRIASSPVKANILKREIPLLITRRLHQYFTLYHDKIFTSDGAIIDDNRLMLIIVAVNMLSSGVWFDINVFCQAHKMPREDAERLLALLYDETLLCRMAKWIPQTVEQTNIKKWFFKLRTDVYDEQGELLYKPTAVFIVFVKKALDHLDVE